MSDTTQSYLSEHTKEQMRDIRRMLGTRLSETAYHYIESCVECAVRGALSSHVEAQNARFKTIGFIKQELTKDEQAEEAGKRR